MPIGAYAQTTTQPSAAVPQVKYQSQKQLFNENTVTIISGQTSGAFLRLAEDMQNVLDEKNKPGGLRILPVVGTPGPQNILDVLFLRGVDMCMTETDYFDYFKTLDHELYGNIEQKILYIAKLYNTEFYVVAKNNINSLSDLKGRRVSFYNKLSSADISGRNIFKLVGVDVEAVNFDQPVATDKLKKGEIDAMVRLAGAPITAFADLKPEDGMHFVPIEPENIPDGFKSKLLQAYLPAQLRAEDFPNLIPAGETVPTLASSVVLAAYNWPEGSDRYRRLANFINAFFSNFDKFKEKTRHPKWAQTNLAANVNGWTRFKAAQQWLDGKRGATAVIAEISPADPAAASFERFLSHVQARGGGSKPFSNAQIQALKQEFSKWRSSEGAGGPGK